MMVELVELQDQEEQEVVEQEVENLVEQLQSQEQLTQVVVVEVLHLRAHKEQLEEKV